MKTPDSWRCVRIVPGSKEGLFSVVHFYSHFPIGNGAKKLLKLDDLKTDSLVSKEQALYVGQKFEDGFIKLDAESAELKKRDRAERKNKS